MPRRNTRELTRLAKQRFDGMRNPNTGAPDAVQVSVRGQRDTDGLYIVRRDHWPFDILVPSSPRDADIPYPRRMPMGFEDAAAQKPVLYWLAPRRTILGPGALPSFFAAWWRLGVRMAYRWFGAAWDDDADDDSTVVLDFPAGLSGTGTIIRTDADGIVYWADGDNLHTLDLTTGAETTTDLGGPITSLCLDETTSQPVSTVQTFTSGTIPGGEDEGYAAGYAEATAESGAFTQGANDCIDVLGYRATEMGEDSLASHPPPGTPSEDYIAGWNNGYLVRYTELYNLGYESEGCTVP